MGITLLRPLDQIKTCLHTLLVPAHAQECSLTVDGGQVTLRPKPGDDKFPGQVPANQRVERVDKSAPLMTFVLPGVQ